MMNLLLPLILLGAVACLLQLTPIDPALRRLLQYIILIGAVVLVLGAVAGALLGGYGQP